MAVYLLFDGGGDFSCVDPEGVLSVLKSPRRHKQALPVVLLPFPAPIPSNPRHAPPAAIHTIAIFPLPPTP